ncbi:hypothetical protein V6N13_015016 [Hibiscus sabdariffa]
MARAIKLTTVFVHNLPEILHWKGLWASFGHHDDVLYVFIPNKRSRSDKRFGFVRFSSKIDADRAISRLNGFALFGSRLSVSIAKYRPRLLYWRKVKHGAKKGIQNSPLSQPYQKISRKKEESAERSNSQSKLPTNDYPRKPGRVVVRSSNNGSPLHVGARRDQSEENGRNGLPSGAENERFQIRVEKVPSPEEMFSIYKGKRPIIIKVYLVPSSSSSSGELSDQGDSTRTKGVGLRANRRQA